MPCSEEDIDVCIIENSQMKIQWINKILTNNIEEDACNLVTISNDKDIFSLSYYEDGDNSRILLYTKNNNVLDMNAIIVSEPIERFYEAFYVFPVHRNGNSEEYLFTCLFSFCYNKKD